MIKHFLEPFIITYFIYIYTQSWPRISRDVTDQSKNGFLRLIAYQLNLNLRKKNLPPAPSITFLNLSPKKQTFHTFNPIKVAKRPNQREAPQLILITHFTKVAKRPNQRGAPPNNPPKPTNLREALKN